MFFVYGAIKIKLRSQDSIHRRTGRLHWDRWILKSRESNWLVLLSCMYFLSILYQSWSNWVPYVGKHGEQQWEITLTSVWNATEGIHFPRRCLEKTRRVSVIAACLKAENIYREPWAGYYTGEACRPCFPWKWVHLDAKQFSEGYLCILRPQQRKMEKDETFSVYVSWKWNHFPWIKGSADPEHL